MSLLPRRREAPSRTDVLVGGVACVIVLGLAVTAPSDVGILLAGAAVGALVGLVALGDPLLALVVVFAASFGRLAQKEIISTEMLTPALGLLVISYALAIKRGEKKPPTLGVVEWLMAAYLAWNILSWMLPHELPPIDPVTGADQDVWRWIFTGTIVPFAAYILAKGVADDERGVRFVLWATVVFSAYSAWVSILQFHGPQSLVWPRYIITDPNWDNRANGVFNQPVVNGLILDMGFLACVFLATRPGVKRWVRLALYGVAFASAYSVYLTHTRVSMLALVVAIGMGIVFARGWRRPFVVSALAGLAGVAANASTFFSSDRASGGVGSSYEVYDRLNIMATSWQAIQEHPLLGVGIARFLAYNTWYHVQWSQHVEWNRGYNLISHENEIGIAAELGIPGALLWIGVVVCVLYLMWRALRELPANEFLGQPLALLGAIAMITLVVNGLTVDLRQLDFATFVPFLYAGMVVIQLERHRARGVRPRPGVPGSGLPGGMSGDDQRAWWDEHDRPHAEAAALPGTRPPDGGPERRLQPSR
ncbi:O-antigen ligase family protein [Actinomycetospora lutea]|uniref:O-antigen ligase family protein n=1 Tax=Actinomycetospora lutea TaxID=663604 RepID=UPI0023671160|nr:O-antigen ligase family protein [Actinomycetospora lutea]MDD7940816.1 O-antigen ligase family protein [Actinomycetospora lutea]